jgi:alpha-glucosidase (family GH31 glycosyl hydrolase)
MSNSVVNPYFLCAGKPILRPVWWLDPRNHDLHQLSAVTSRQFLVGDDLLVAPALCVGERRRAIYVPHGVWRDVGRNALVLGPKLMENYRVGLYEIPYFVRQQIYEDEYNSETDVFS